MSIPTSTTPRPGGSGQNSDNDNQIEPHFVKPLPNPRPLIRQIDTDVTSTISESDESIFLPHNPDYLVLRQALSENKTLKMDKCQLIVELNLKKSELISSESSRESLQERFDQIKNTYDAILEERRVEFQQQKKSPTSSDLMYMRHEADWRIAARNTKLKRDYQSLKTQFTHVQNKMKEMTKNFDKLQAEHAQQAEELKKAKEAGDNWHKEMCILKEEINLRIKFDQSHSKDGRFSPAHSSTKIPQRYHKDSMSVPRTFGVAAAVEQPENNNGLPNNVEDIVSPIQRQCAYETEDESPSRPVITNETTGYNGDNSGGTTDPLDTMPSHVVPNSRLQSAIPQPLPNFISEQRSSTSDTGANSMEEDVDEYQSTTDETSSNIIIISRRVSEDGSSTTASCFRRSRSHNGNTPDDNRHVDLQNMGHRSTSDLRVVEVRNVILQQSSPLVPTVPTLNQSPHDFVLVKVYTRVPTTQVWHFVAALTGQRRSGCAGNKYGIRFFMKSRGGNRTGFICNEGEQESEIDERNIVLPLPAPITVDARNRHIFNFDFTPYPLAEKSPYYYIF